MLPDSIPQVESRALARRLLEPCWKALDEKNDAAKFNDLAGLVMVDPFGVLQRMDGIAFPGPRMKGAMQTQAVRGLAQIDLAAAETVTESIDEPGDRSKALVAIFDALPDQNRKYKVALLDRATLQAKAATVPGMRGLQMAEVAQRWYELGEKEKAKALLSDAFRLAKSATPKGTPVRRILAARLACADLPSAIAIAKEFPATGINTESSVLANIAFHLAAENPSEAERVLSLMPPERGRDRFPPAIACKMAAVDPVRASRLTNQAQREMDRPQRYLYLALGLKSSDPAASSQAFQTAMHGFDRLMKDGPEYSRSLGPREIVLPMVEQIDPALVPEYFWRLVAMRPSVGDPHSVSDVPLAKLALLLAWYDLDVATAVFEPVRAGIARADNQDLADARWAPAFRAWSIIDPRAAVARLEQVPVTPKLDFDAGYVRQEVAKLLGLPHEARWRDVWLDSTHLTDLLVRDL
jgi:hypothetical protein